VNARMFEHAARVVGVARARTRSSRDGRPLFASRDAVRRDDDDDDDDDDDEDDDDEREAS